MISIPHAALEYGYNYYPLVAVSAIPLALILFGLSTKISSAKWQGICMAAVPIGWIATFIASMIAMSVVGSNHKDLREQVADDFYTQFGGLLENADDEDTGAILTDEALKDDRPVPVTVNESGERYPGHLVLEEDPSNPDHYSLSLETDR